MDDTGAGSPSMLLPLRSLMPGRRGGRDSSLDRRLAVVPSKSTAITTITAPFQLPQNWGVEEVQRPDGSRVDKYYLEPGTGHKFRSMKEVQRHITGVEYTSYSRRVSKHVHVGNFSPSSAARRMIVSEGMLLRLDMDAFDQHRIAVVDPSFSPIMCPYNLPDGWILEEVPRGCRCRSCNKSYDKYYYEPGTGLKFRSMVSVEKYLAESGDDKPLSEMFNLTYRVKSSNKQKNVPSEKMNSSTSNSASPPHKVNWVLADSGGSTWNAFVGETMVPESEKQQWANEFMLTIGDETRFA